MRPKPTPHQLPTTADVEVSDRDLMLALTGPGEENLRVLEQEFGIEIGLRGETIRLQGGSEQVAGAERALGELLDVISRGKHFTEAEIRRAVRTLRDHPDVKLKSLFEDVVLHVQARRRVVAPKNVTQQVYIQAIRDQDIVFGIGPAGTGKTYLAMAMAVRELMEKRVKRIVLTRPAVEAGEKLGFLPGDLAEKVNPYLRPLYDALNDMMDLDKAQALIQRGAIEVAPLAFMRGRSQCVFSKVLTPSGWRPIGSLRVGDSVIGSDGRPTRVLGRYPQGRKEVFRLTTQDGASTICCGEHLWTVLTGGPLGTTRVMQTRDIAANLGPSHQPTYAIPLLSEPVRMAARGISVDGYVLGTLLGSGNASAALGEPVLDARQQVCAGSRAIGVPHGPTLPIGGHEMFVPDDYLWNSASTRLAVLQGLLDSEDGVALDGGRVEYTTTSLRLRDDVIFLVRSLGGVARSRGAAAFVVDIRLPLGMMPFRLPRKAEKFVEAGGGGRPTRFIESIEPAGEAETICIRVEAEDSLYVTDDFLLTHNTLNDSFVILDEAQNTTTEQMKMFLTRLGFESKAVVTGDVTQVDLPEGRKSGLNDAVDLLSGVDGIRFVYFTDADVVRHPLVQRIVRAYDERDARRARSHGREEGGRHGQ